MNPRTMTTGGWSACACSSQNPRKRPPHTTAAGGPGRTDSRPLYTPQFPQIAQAVSPVHAER